VVIVDDLLATGGTFLAAASLIEKVGGKVEKLLSLISLDDADLASHPSRKSLEKYQVESVLHYKN
jgi:adenine phosphoribosyltransferase